MVLRTQHPDLFTEKQHRYVLLTAARNEEQNIAGCIESVLLQTVPPCKWVIVSDGSTDKTDQIIHEYARGSQLILFIRKHLDPEMKGFSSKVAALNIGVSFLNDINWRMIGILDADITVGKNYYAIMLNKFCENDKLGIGGGYIFENDNGVFRSRSMNSPWSVAGGIQLFRSECYQDIGGLSPMALGGEDWHAEIKARMKGWEVRAFPEIPAYHHSPGIGKRGLTREGVRCGALDYSMGTHPLFEIFKCLRRIKEKPMFISAFFQMYGFVKGYLAGHQREMSRDVVDFLRKEQIARLRDKVLFYRKGTP